jgi:ABC-type transport system involved in cytochrome bd biosynthesis fused ATPase/permease subunit
LFDLSIEENITLGSNINSSQLEQVIKVAKLEELMVSSSHETPATVGEMGRNLSGGQIKRISIARTMLEDVAVYILDEPTSNLNQEIATEIMQRVFAYRPHAIFFVVTHDLNLAKSCDIVIDLNKN